MSESPCISRTIIAIFSIRINATVAVEDFRRYSGRPFHFGPTASFCLSAEPFLGPPAFFCLVRRSGRGDISWFVRLRLANSDNFTGDKNGGMVG